MRHAATAVGTTTRCCDSVSLRPRDAGTRAVIWVALVLFWPASTLSAEAPAGGALAGERPRVIVSTDIGGSDPDDFQSLVHLLVYADVLDLEGLVSSPPKEGRVRDLLEVFGAYERDYPGLREVSDAYPPPDELRSIVRQGAIEAASETGHGAPTDGSRWIVERARAPDPRGSGRPLWILVWGSITDVAQAVHDDPSIKKRVRIYSIGSWNTRNDRAARRYLFENHPDLWWIESDTTFRGMYMGGKQGRDLGNRSFVEEHVRGHGALGALFFAKKPGIKMGDTPSLLYLLRGPPDDPAAAHWGGAFAKPEPEKRPTYWSDSPSPALRDAGKDGARTVNRWRADFLRDWQVRMDRVRAKRAVTKPGVTLVENAIDESAGNLPCFRIETANATYFLEKSGAGLSSLLDREGADWIGFRPDPGTGAAGEYRGFPNAVHKQAGSYFHPMNRGTDRSITRVEHANHERVTISARSDNGLWAGRYDFFATHCTFTMTRMPGDKKYWVLYEGTPGGQYDATDWWLASGARERAPLTTRHDVDLPAPEWIAFGDARLDRCLLLVHHEDDAHPDRFYQMHEKMTVFGFGRSGLEKYLDRVPQSFSIGIVERSDREALRRAAQIFVRRAAQTFSRRAAQTFKRRAARAIQEPPKTEKHHSREKHE